MLDARRWVQITKWIWPFPGRWLGHRRLSRVQSLVGQMVQRALWQTQQQQFTDEEQAILDRIEAVRHALFARTDVITDGFQHPSSLEKITDTFEVGPMAQRGSIRPNWGQFLFALVRQMRPERCLELGTFFGLSALFQAAALEYNGSGHLFTIDQLKEVSRIAAENLQIWPTQRVTVIQGRFLDVLETDPRLQTTFDLVFYDGSHEAEATRVTFERFWSRVRPGGGVLFDDVDWSWGMHRAWQQIRRRPDVSLSIDTGQYGLCFKTDDGQPVEHFDLWPGLLAKRMRHLIPLSGCDYGEESI